MPDASAPDVMPVLSAGKHRNPQKGACFMEFVSYLAGERWSDHPSCTHSLLALLARDVNDHVHDRARSRLVPLIPLVIGLDGPDPRVHALIARQAAWSSLPVASAGRQGVAAVGIRRCERVLNDLAGRPAGHLSSKSAALLADAPYADRWARDFSGIGFGGRRSFIRHSAPAIVHSAVVGISEASVPDPDRLLIDLLTETVEQCREWLGAAHPVPAPERSSSR